MRSGPLHAGSLSMSLEFIGWIPRNPLGGDSPAAKRNGWAAELYLHLCAGTKAQAAHAWYLRQAWSTSECEEYDFAYDDPEKRIAWVEKWGCVLEETFIERSLNEPAKMQEV
jgi:hypothetical protein